MQTFLPHSDFKISAKVLDRQRLGKQRVECLQILNTLLHKKKAWSNHPAVKMWQTYENHLVDYGVAVCEEWVGRGYKDTCLDKIKALQSLSPNGFKGMPPTWLGDPRFHSAHRAALLHKNYDHYKQFNWAETLELNYVWPTHG